MDETLAVKEVASLLHSVVGWGGFLGLLYMFREGVVRAFSLGAAAIIRDADEKTQRTLIKMLVRRGITLRELYSMMKEDEETSAGSASEP
jgi:hypothetical protein